MQNIWLPYNGGIIYGRRIYNRQASKILAVLWLANMPAVLNEGAFVDNKKDIEDWNDDAELKKLGIAYAHAAAEYLELEKKAVSPEPSAPEAESTLYCVQVGAFKVKENAEAMQKKLTAAGFDAYITQK